MTPPYDVYFHDPAHDYVNSHLLRKSIKYSLVVGNIMGTSLNYAIASKRIFIGEGVGHIIIIVTFENDVSKVHDYGHNFPQLILILWRKVQNLHGPLHPSKQLRISDLLSVAVVRDVTCHTVSLNDTREK